MLQLHDLAQYVPLAELPLKLSSTPTQYFCVQLRAVPTFRHFRILNIVGLVGTTFTELCALQFAVYAMQCSCAAQDSS